MPHGTARGPHVRLCGQFTAQPHVWCDILGTSSSRTFTARAPHVRLCGEFTSQPNVFTSQPHVRCGILAPPSVALSLNNKQLLSEMVVSYYSVFLVPCVWFLCSIGSMFLVPVCWFVCKPSEHTYSSV